MKKYLFLRLFLKKKKRKKTILPRKFITHFIFLYLSLTYHMEYKINLSSCINLFNSHTRYTICLYFINKYLIKTLFPHVKHLSIDILKRTNIAFKSISRFKLNLVAKHLEYWMKIRSISNYFSEPILYKTIFTIPRISQYILKYIYTLYLSPSFNVFTNNIFFIHTSQKIRSTISFEISRLVKIRSQAIHPLIRLFSTTLMPPPDPCDLLLRRDRLYARKHVRLQRSTVHTHTHIYIYIQRVPRKRKRYTATKEIHAQEINFRPWR